jgi:hypothetical protein
LLQDFEEIFRFQRSAEKEEMMIDKFIVALA